MAAANNNGSPNSDSHSQHSPGKPELLPTSSQQAKRREPPSSDIDLTGPNKKQKLEESTSQPTSSQNTMFNEIGKHRRIINRYPAFFDFGPDSLTFYRRLVTTKIRNPPLWRTYQHSCWEPTSPWELPSFVTTIEARKKREGNCDICDTRHPEYHYVMRYEETRELIKS